jgi:hypothetical protein
MKLEEIDNLLKINGYITDKNTSHSYLPLYEELLNGKKFSAKNVIEIGIGDFNAKNGGSIAMWRNYFPNAKIHGVDKLHISRVYDVLVKDPKVELYTSVDGYDENFIRNAFVNSGIKFDFMLDDGPHTLESMKKFIELYSDLLEDDGIMIIEDVQSIDWLDELKNVVPESLKPYVKTFDLRENKNKYDDIVFAIICPQKS